MKHFPERFRSWTAVGICLHDVFHELPPAPATLRGRDCGPLGCALDLSVAEKSAGLLVQEDRVVMHPVILQPKSGRRVNRGLRR